MAKVLWCFSKGITKNTYSGSAQWYKDLKFVAHF